MIELENIRTEINTTKGQIIQTISNEYVTKKDQELFTIWRIRKIGRSINGKNKNLY